MFFILVKNKYKLSIPILIFYFLFNNASSEDLLFKNISEKNNIKSSNYSYEKINWEKINNRNLLKKDIKWQKLSEDDKEVLEKIDVGNNEKYFKSNSTLSILNRSIIFNDNIVGPDIAWLVPPGLIWNKKYKFDSSLRGHNRRKKGESFWGWNEGDAVGQFYYQFIRTDKYSFGLNIGMRSVYQGSKKGGGSNIGEGLSSGFRIDRKLSDSSGISFGAEQLLHFDGLTDTGRDIYLTLSKGWWDSDFHGQNGFPLLIATAGFGTGKLAEGNVKGLCSNFLGGSGTEVNHQRSLCWAPIFSIAKVYNKKFSTFFEYNSKWFLIGSSIAPFEQLPLRGTFAIQLSDHIDNYKLNNFNEMKWVFRLNLGF